MLRHVSTRHITILNALHATTKRWASTSPEWRRAIETKNDLINALVYVAKDIESAHTQGPLSDVPIAIKDNICTTSMPTTCSSAMLISPDSLGSFKSPYDATVVKLLREASAPIVGKANCDEFGMGSLNLWSTHGATLNPHHISSDSHSGGEARAAGGSSGGSAAAVAAGMCTAALGTDTGGSVRLPASYCGIVGLKPSYGIISRWGVVSYADSLDCVGVLGKTVDYVRRVFHTVAKYDKNDPTAATPETRRKAEAVCQTYLSQLKSSQDLANLRIGIPQEYFPAELSPEILLPLRKVIRSLQERAATIVPVSLPSTPYALSAYYVIASAEASSNMARYDGVQYGLRIDPDHTVDKRKAANIYAMTRSIGFGPEVQRRILLGTYALTASAFDNYFLQAQRVRNLVKADFDRVFRAANVLRRSDGASSASAVSGTGVDVLLHPSAIGTAPPLVQDADRAWGPKNSRTDSLDAYLQDVLTVPASLAGLPAMSVPAGLGEDKWPVGVSVVGQWGCDEMVLKIGQIIEEVVQ